MTTVKFKNKTYNLAEMDKASLLDLKLKIDFEANRVQTNITLLKTAVVGLHPVPPSTTISWLL